jgi:hypothetical protein
MGSQQLNYNSVYSKQCSYSETECGLYPVLFTYDNFVNKGAALHDPDMNAMNPHHLMNA